jgi:hypothetical protein
MCTHEVHVDDTPAALQAVSFACFTEPAPKGASRLHAAVSSGGA